MAYTFSFTLTDSSTTRYYSDEIIVAVDDWEIGLVNFQSYYSIPNVTLDNDRILTITVDDNYNFIRLPVGAYTLEDLNSAINTNLFPGQYVNLTLHGPTNRVHLRSNLDIDFREGSLAPLLGFNPGRYIHDRDHYAQHAPNLAPVEMIRIHCNIVQGSYEEEAHAHILHEFSPTIPTGYKIIEAPDHVIYLPLNVKRITEITLRVTDQDNKPLDFRGERIYIRLELKRRSWG